MRTLTFVVFLLAVAGCGDGVVCINADQDASAGATASGCVGSGCDEVPVECPIPPDCEGDDCGP